MLTEDQVVAAVSSELQQRGYEIVQQTTASKQGVDIIAKNEHGLLLIEAKGAGSSKSYTPRYGMEFDAKQVFDHVAKAVLKALRVISAGNGRAGIAFPDNEDHRQEVQQAAAALRRLDIAVFWVRDDHSVQVDSPWHV